jgi:hypothetical protein
MPIIRLLDATFDNCVGSTVTYTTWASRLHAFTATCLLLGAKKICFLVIQIRAQGSGRKSRCITP